MTEIKDKHITILGAVRSGIAAAILAKKMGAIPFVSDYSSELSAVPELDENSISYELGGHSDKVYNCDFIITSPGVPTNSVVIVNAIAKGIKIFSEIEFASWFCKGNIIAITGSNGKTTTASLCAHTLNKCGINTYLAGNIGLAFSEIVLDVKEDDFVTLEVSSFQLDFIDSFKPKYAVILNITPDHLDRYDNNFEQYASSKLGINRNQDDEDFIIVNSDDSVLSKSKFENGIRIEFGFNKVEKGVHKVDDQFVYNKLDTTENICSTDILKIRGEHNQYNAMAVICISKMLGLENDLVAEALSSFDGVEHRLEFVRNINGIDFINDSKATNVDSVRFALNSFSNPIRLILGGKDKGNDYNQIEDLVIKNVVKIYAIGSSAEKIVNYFNSKVDVEKVDSFENAITNAYNESKNGDIVLLSPACASFDMFKNYEERGKNFKNMVMNLK